MAEPRIPEKQIDDDSAPLDGRDHRRLSRVERSLERGRQIWEWWEEAAGEKWSHELDSDQLRKLLEESGGNPDTFQLLRPLPHWGGSEVNCGFFDEIPIDGKKHPVMGVALQTFFDEPKRRLVEVAQDREQALENWRDGFREYVMGYLIRVTSFHEIAPFVEQSRGAENFLRPFNWCLREEDQRGGFGMSQLYYKRHDGLVGKFWEEDQTKIDLRNVEDGKYEWIVVGVRIHDVHLRFPAFQWLSLSIKDTVLGVLGPEFILRDDRRVGGLCGRYGFGYAILEDPAEESSKSFTWRRPEFGVQFNQFLIRDTAGQAEDGQILGRVILVTERGKKLVSVNPWSWPLDFADLTSQGWFTQLMNMGLSLADVAAPRMFDRLLEPIKEMVERRPLLPTLDPISTFATIANSASLGLASKKLCMSKDQMLKILLADFGRSGIATLIGSRGVWRAISDWTREEQLPGWLKR